LFRFKTEDEAISIANMTSSGLAGMQLVTIFVML